MEEAIESVEEFIDIKQELNNARNDCYSNETYDKYYETLKSCLEFYGDVLEMTDEGVVIRVSMKDNIESLSDSELQEIINDFMDNIEHPPASKKAESEQFLERVFDYFTENVWRQPKFQISDYWYPYCENSEFNSHVFDRLGDL